MDNGAAFGSPESGVIKFFKKERDYGFVALDSGGPDLFFSSAALYRANMQHISKGVRVVFTRGVSHDDRQRVERFLEIGGVPAEHGRYEWDPDGSFRFCPDAASGAVEAGVVESFNKERGFGFILLDQRGAHLFFFIAQLMEANMDHIEPGTRVSIMRGPAKDGRPKVSRFVEIGGKPVTAGRFAIVNGRFVFNPDGKPPPEAQEASAPRVAGIKEAKQDAKPAQPQKAAPAIDKDEWLTVAIKKLRSGHVSYALSESLGQIKVPWSVLQAAKITSAQNHDRFEVKCEPGDDLLVAHSIRRY